MKKSLKEAFEEDEPMEDLEMINQNCEKQKGKTAYEKKYRKQIKTKLLKIKKLYRGEIH